MDLPMRSTAKRERADAARNRARILEAAGKVLARDAAGATMEQLAAAAQVGKGTLYRCYPDKAAIAGALLDEHERELQDRLLSGPPPLGPGAPPHERLAAFYSAMVELLEAHGHLSRAVETDAQRLETGAHGAWRLHVAGLVADAGLDADPQVLAEQLLAPLSPTLYERERRLQGRTPGEIVEALTRLADLLRPPSG